MHDTNSPTPIDPRLTEDTTRLTPQPLSLPTRGHDDHDGGADEGEGDGERSDKRQKLNLWKCRQCRDARKKCFPTGREWPNKCDRCRLHKPEPLDCSEPERNDRKRGKNKEDKTRDKARDKEKDKDKEKNQERGKDLNLKPLKRSKTSSTTSGQEPRSRGSSYDSDDDRSDDTTIFDRPQPTMVGIKREYPGASVPKPKSTISKEDWRPSICYQPLGPREFRILHLDPGALNDNKISCSLVVVSMDLLPKYEAVSYLWSDKNPELLEIQMVDSHKKSHTILIRRHLYEALRNLRHPTKVRSFWVDALCVNYGSGDNVEKNSQAPKKRFVFRNAQNLCFWLGEDETSKKALDFIPKILELNGIDQLVKNESAMAGWTAFVTLLTNPVFSRLWLVQELAVAQNATLHCGQSARHYVDLVDAVAMFNSVRPDISLTFQKYGKSYKELYDRRVTMAARFIEVSTNALRITTGPHNEPKAERLLSLEALVSYLSELTAANPLDRIYSVLAIAKDGPKLDERTLMTDEKTLITDEMKSLKIDFDYDVTVADLYQKFVRLTIKNSKSLNIICRYWASQAPGLPTWVRPLQSLQPVFDNISSERTQADSLVGLPDHNIYHASRGTVAEVTTTILPEGMHSLNVRGYLLDTILRLLPRSSEGIILYEWLQHGGCKRNENELVIPDEFWRTLVADRGPYGMMVPSWYKRAFIYCVLHSPTGDINTSRLIMECEKDSHLVVLFLHRVRSVIWNRKFLICGNNGRIGLAPTAAQEGDSIAILNGCSVPVVLRQTGGVWQLVGECYVHGMMDGDAIDAAKASGNKEEVFVIV